MQPSTSTFSPYYCESKEKFLKESTAKFENQKNDKVINKDLKNGRIDDLLNYG